MLKLKSLIKHFPVVRRRGYCTSDYYFCLIGVSLDICKVSPWGHICLCVRLKDTVLCKYNFYFLFSPSSKQSMTNFMDLLLLHLLIRLITYVLDWGTESSPDFTNSESGFFNIKDAVLNTDGSLI